MEISILLCDDEEIHNRILTQYLANYEQTSEHSFNIFVSNNPYTALKIVEKNTIQLALLDVDLGKLSGIDLGKKIKSIDKDINLIYVTSFPDFAISAIKTRAFDYILKPITPSKLEAALKDFFDHMSQQQEEDSTEFLVIETSKGLFKREIKRILYIEKVGRYIYIRSKSESFQISHTIKELLENSAIQTNFVQCHQSILVNKSKIVDFKKQSVHLRDLDTALPVSRSYKKQVEAEFYNYLLVRPIGDVSK